MQTRVRRIGSMSKSSSTNSDMAAAEGGGRRQVPLVGRHSDPCRVCHKSVFILERLNVGGRILHRTCFKCARCETQLSLAGYYETEAEEYCCEVCPDEENSSQKQAAVVDDVTSVPAQQPVVDCAQSDQADSGHSSEDSKDIEDIEDEEIHLGDSSDEKVDDGRVCPAAESEQVVAATSSSRSVESDELNANDNTGLGVPDIAVDDGSADGCSAEKVDENENNVEDSIVTECANSIKEVSVAGEETKDSYPSENNPFGDSGDDADNDINDNASCGKDAIATETVANRDNQSTNPFGSDLESDTEGQIPTTPAQTSHPLSVGKNEPKSNLSLNPFGSGFSSEEDCSQGSVSPSPSLRSHTRRTKKKRRAPLPPGVSPGGSLQPGGSPRLNSAWKPPTPAPRTSLTPGSVRHSPSSTTAPAEAAKRIKDENNMNRRSQILESIKNEAVVRATPPQLPSIPSQTNLSQANSICDAAAQSDTASINQSDSLSLMSASTTTQSSAQTSSGLAASQVFSPLPDKADEGQWRKKKGPAPPRPIPPKRTVTKLHRKAINIELADIEVKQSELERQGVKLEKTIREICDKSDEDGENRDSLGPEAEDLIIQLFDLVNEKNELFRRQTELIYMKKDNRLEEQHADLEYQIRILMSRPESQKSEEDVGREEKLIKKLIEVVGLRNEIVDCLEMDRLRERDEDTAIEDHMSNYAAVKQPEEQKKGISKMLRMKKKKKKKDKDDEKDVDTSEIPETGELDSTEKKKKSTKKKLMKYASKKLAFPH